MNLKRILFFILIIVLAILIFIKTKENTPPSVEINNEEGQTELSILGNKDDLIFLSILPKQNITGIFELEGEVKGGYFFEANILVNILDSEKNLLKEGYGTATTDWMTADAVSFKASIDATGLSGEGFIELKQDDPSDGEGGPAKSILIPVVME